MRALPRPRGAGGGSFVQGLPPQGVLAAPRPRLASLEGGYLPGLTLSREPRPAPAGGHTPADLAPAGCIAAAGLLCHGRSAYQVDNVLVWPSSGYFFSSSGGVGGGWGRALGVASGSQSRNSCRSVLTVSGHSSITMWLPSSMSLRKAKSRICGGGDGAARHPLA